MYLKNQTDYANTNWHRNLIWNRKAFLIIEYPWEIETVFEEIAALLSRFLISSFHRENKGGWKSLDTSQCNNWAQKTKKVTSVDRLLLTLAPIVLFVNRLSLTQR